MPQNNQPSTGKKIFAVLLPLLLYFIISLISQIIYMSSLIGILSYETMTDPEMLYEAMLKLVMEHQVILTVIASLAVIPVMLFMFLRDRRRRMAVQTGPSRFDGLYDDDDPYRIPEKSQAAPVVYGILGRGKPLDYAIIALLGVCCCALFNGLLILSGVYSNLDMGTVEQQAAMYTGKIPLEVFGLAIAGAFAEELVFRGLVLLRIEDGFNTKAAVIWSALIFALFHGNLLQGLYTLALGLVLGLIYVRVRSLLAPFVLHAAANLFTILQNESGFLNNVYGSTSGQILLSLGGVVVLLACLYLLLKRIPSESAG